MCTQLSNHIFDMVDGVVGNQRKALDLYYELDRTNKPPTADFVYVHRGYWKPLFCKSIDESGVWEKVICIHLLHPFVVGKSMVQ